jgi:hypothetical protein
MVGQAAMAGYRDERLRCSVPSFPVLVAGVAVRPGDRGGRERVSGVRLGSIAHAVRRLADMASPDRLAQAQRIDEEIAELQRRKDDVLDGRGGTATVAQLSEQLCEVLAMTRSLPADFRQLRSMVEERHKMIARDALAETPEGRHGRVVPARE